MLVGNVVSPLVGLKTCESPTFWCGLVAAMTFFGVTWFSLAGRLEFDALCAVETFVLCDEMW